jgi:hypothetical protein
METTHPGLFRLSRTAAPAIFMLRDIAAEGTEAGTD